MLRVVVGPDEELLPIESVADAERAALAKGLGTRVIQSLASSFGVAPDWSANGSGMHLRIDAAA